MKKAYQTKEMTSEEPARAPFSLPEIQVNPSGWGPSTIETKFKDMPYQPFSKSDRLGKVCQCPRTDLNKRSLPRPKTTTA